MRYSLAWAGVAAQNSSLKAATGLLSLTTLVLGICLVRSSLRQPLLIERGCESNRIFPASSERTPSEIETFVRLAIRQRLDTDYGGSLTFLSEPERSARKKEHAELERKNMQQRIIVNGVEVKDDVVSVEADRLISVGKVRSAFRFPLKVTLQSIRRTEVNPYGLILTGIDYVKEEEKQ